MNNSDRCTLEKLNTKGWRNKDCEFKEAAQKFICKHVLKLLNKFALNEGAK